MVLAFIAVAVSCQDPTQVTVRITTGERCGNISAVQTVVGPNPGETQARFDRAFSSAASDQAVCDDARGLVGTLVVTPGGSSGSILVAVGVRGGDGSPAPEATRCRDPEVAKRCIIARRTFSFIENKPLTLPIHLDPLCIGKTCDPASTCFKGSCVSATTICSGSDCGLVEENPGTGTGEGGANDATSSDGAYDADLDGPGFEDVFDAGSDAGSATDAQSDANTQPDAAGMDAATIYPNCSLSGNLWLCAAQAGWGTQTPGACDGSGGSTPCCRCNCPPTMTAVSCTSAFSCTPVDPSCPVP